MSTDTDTTESTLDVFTTMLFRYTRDTAVSSAPITQKHPLWNSMLGMAIMDYDVILPWMLDHLEDQIDTEHSDMRYSTWAMTFILGIVIRVWYDKQPVLHDEHRGSINEICKMYRDWREENNV